MTQEFKGMAYYVRLPDDPFCGQTNADWNKAERKAEEIARKKAKELQKMFPAAAFAYRTTRVTNRKEGLDYVKVILTMA